MIKLKTQKELAENQLSGTYNIEAYREYFRNVDRLNMLLDDIELTPKEEYTLEHLCQGADNFEVILSVMRKIRNRI